MEEYKGKSAFNERIIEELEAYAKEMQDMHAWILEKEAEKKRDGSRRDKPGKVPNKEARPEKPACEEDYEEDLDFDDLDLYDEDVVNNEKTCSGTPSGPVPKGETVPSGPLLHYMQYDQAVPILQVETARAAAMKIRDFQILSSSIPQSIVTFIDDDGQHRITGAASFQDAKILVEKEVQEYLDDLNDEGRMQEVFIDEDGTGGLYPATPVEFINDDESHKCEAAARGLLHIFRGDDHYIIYNALAEKTARWDIFSIDKVFLSTDKTSPPHDGQNEPDRNSARKEKPPDRREPDNRHEKKHFNWKKILHIP